MMARAWLILADILVHLLLFLSLILFFLYPLPKPTKHEVCVIPPKIIEKPYKLEGRLPLVGLDLNVTMSMSDIERMAQQCSAEEYRIEQSVYLAHTLEERLRTVGAKMGDPIFIRIFKEEALLEVWIYKNAKYEHLKDYIICASSGYLGPKLKEGDRQAPEGFYKVKRHQLNPNSKYHLSFNLGYPNAYDRAHERTGTFLMVHGDCVSIGCYAMTDEKIEEIYALVEAALKKGQKSIAVHAFPFYMTAKNMDLYEGNIWYDFWTNLKEGYDYFEDTHLVPKVKVENKRYEIYE